MSDPILLLLGTSRALEEPLADDKQGGTHAIAASPHRHPLRTEVAKNQDHLNVVKP
jgi:hypothetical protein